MISEQYIPCPVCQSKISFDPIALVKGHKFSCPGCFAVVGIAQEALETASHTLEKYEAIKKHSNKVKRNKAQRQIQ